MEKITFVTDDGGKEEFYVEEQTRINGVNYILVSDSKDDEANAYILKDISTDTDAEANTDTSTNADTDTSILVFI
jgi:hypothetical protein